MLDARKRDGEKPTFPLQDDPRLKTSNILKAHEILRNGLQQFLEFREEDLGFYLNHIVVVKNQFLKMSTAKISDPTIKCLNSYGCNTTKHCAKITLSNNTTWIN